MKRRGFSLYLTFLITTVVFILVTSSYEVSKISLDLGRSAILETVVFHAADGGLERGLGRLSQSFKPFSMSYRSQLSPHRTVEVMVEAIFKNGKIDLNATAALFEGNRELARQTLSRLQISKIKGRAGIGKFVEAT